MAQGAAKSNGVSVDGVAAAEALSFEDALERVESIIERIEKGEVGLEESITEYERGVELIKRCRGLLKKAELRVEDLTGKMKAEGAE